jgi:hypothetical protein
MAGLIGGLHEHHIGKGDPSLRQLGQGCAAEALEPWPRIDREMARYGFGDVLMSQHEAVLEELRPGHCMVSAVTLVERKDQDGRW